MLREPMDERIKALSLVLLRLWLAQEFVHAAFQKLSGGWMPPAWFVDLTLPPLLAWLGPQINWLVAGVGELVLGLALALGLFTRLAACGLLLITWVAVYAVHFDLGWAGWRQIETDAGQGFKLPLMIALMLLTLVAHGGGKWSAEQRLSQHSRRL